MVDSPPTRSQELDLIKGCLVIMMVVYHSASSSREARVNLAITYAIPFVHGAFLMVTGFLCGYHYWPMLRRSRGTVRKRLLSRAARLALLFLGCNIALYTLGVGPDPSRLAAVLRDPRAVAACCIVGISTEYFAFEVLMYIAEFLCLAAMVARYPRGGHLVLAAIALLAVVAGGNTLLFLAFGAVGLEVGIVAGKGWLAACDTCLRKAWPAMLVLLAVDIAVRSGHEPLLSNAVKLPLRSVETALWFCVFVGFGAHGHWWTERLALLGKYTLFAYLFQMLVLRILVGINEAISVSGWQGYFLYAAVTTAATYTTVLLLDGLRRRSEIDSFYRLAFG